MTTYQRGQASVEWMLLSILVMLALVVVEENWSVIDYLIETGNRVREFYDFIWRHLVLIPGGGS